MIEILEFTADGDTPLVRLGCSCGRASLAAYTCDDDDQIIYCTNCGEITSRSRLSNAMTRGHEAPQWRWQNVSDRDECPMITMMLPVRIAPAGAGEDAALDGCVTKMSNDRCLLRLDGDPSAIPELLEGRSHRRLVILAKEGPLADRIDCELEDVIHPHGSTRSTYFKLRLLPEDQAQAEKLRRFYQAACGLRFDWQVLLYADRMRLGELRRQFVECLPEARLEIVHSAGEFLGAFRRTTFDLLVMPALPELMQAVRNEALAAERLAPMILALVRQRTADEVANALRWGAQDVLHERCAPGELRRVLEGCLDRLQPDPSCSIIPRPPRQNRNQMNESILQVTAADEETIHLLLMASETHDPHTSNHLKRIAAYCAAVANRLGWSSERVAQLATASKLHDVGKIGVPDEILRKTGTLTQDERRVMQQHTRLGHKILQSGRSPLLQLAAIIALRHHEQWGGKGYPDGLAGEDIPLEAQVVSIADVFDALTTARPYKPAWTNERTLDFLRENRGVMFAPAVVDAFMAGYEEIQRAQLAFLDDFRDIWTERRRHVRIPIPPVAIRLEIAMPEQTFRPYHLVGHLTNISEGGLKARITNVSHDLFSSLVSTRRYGKIYCNDPDWQEIDNASCEIVWVDYYAVPDPNTCLMGLGFHRARPNLIDVMRRFAECVADEAYSATRTALAPSNG